MKLRASMSLSVLLLGAALSVGRVARADGVQSGDRAHVTVSVAGLRSDRGAVRCIAYDGPERFPEGNQRVIARVSARPNGASATCEFAGLPRGRDIAVVIHHDENDDRVFQRGVFGIPLEGYGFSNDARPILAAPSFDACKFRPLGERWSVRITARY